MFNMANSCPITASSSCFSIIPINPVVTATTEFFVVLPVPNTFGKGVLMIAIYRLDTFYLLTGFSTMSEDSDIFPC